MGQANNEKQNSGEKDDIVNLGKIDEMFEGRVEYVKKGEESGNLSKASSVENLARYKNYDQ